LGKNRRRKLKGGRKPREETTLKPPVLKKSGITKTKTQKKKQLRKGMDPW